MNKIKRIRELKTVLESLVEEDLFIPIREARIYFLDRIEDFVQRLERRSLAIDNPSGLLSVISEELENLREIIEEKKSSNLADAYLNAVKKHTIDLAEEVTISQSESRFKQLESDTVGVKFVKFQKRSVRTIGTFWQGFSNIFRKSLHKPTKAYGPWTQKIPLRRLAEFHLCKTEDIIRNWIDRDHQFVTSIIVGLEQYMAKDFPGTKFCAEGKIHKESLENLLNQILDEVGEEKNRLDEQLQGDFEIIHQDVIYYMERAGTLERRTGFYHESKVERKSSQLRATLSNYLERWNEAHLHLLDKTKTIKEFLSFKEELEDESKEFLSSLETFFKNYLLHPLQSLQQDLGGIRTKLQEFQKRRELESANHLLTDSKKLLTKLINEIQKELKTAIQETQLSLKSNLFAEHGLLKANNISEHGLFIYDLELEKLPPSLDHKIIEWRLSVVRSLKELLFNKLQPSNQHYEDFLAQIKSYLDEVLQIVEVNLESAIELFGSKEKEGDPFLTAIEALERTHSKLEDSIDSVEEKHENLKLVVLEGGDEFCNKMLHLIHIGDSKELQMLDAKYKVKEKTQGWQIKASARVARVQDSIGLIWRFSWKKIKQYVSAISQFLGFAEQEVQQVTKTDVATYLSETDAKIKELPYIYRRLFNFDLETDRRFYVLLNENFAYLKKAYQSWENRFPATFAVIGEKGSGKTTYINYALEDFFKGSELKQINVTGSYFTEGDFIKFMESELDFEGVDSIEDIISAIQNGQKKKVIVIDDLQNFYLRKINGYEALESLLYIISETKESAFWIVSCSQYAWNFMDKTVAVGEYFSHLIRTDTLNEQQIESVILNRHRSSGYELIFEPSSAQSKSRAYRKLMDQEEASHKYLKEAYFEDLTNLSEGNASIAMIFWIRSIREFDDTHFYLKPIEVTSLEMIQELKPEVLFTLAAIILHDAVTPEELSEVLSFTDQESRLMLMRLKTRGLLQQKEERYDINHLMYRQIVRVLKERNIIHLV